MGTKRTSIKFDKMVDWLILIQFFLIFQHKEGLEIIGILTYITNLFVMGIRILLFFKNYSKNGIYLYMISDILCFFNSLFSQNENFEEQLSILFLFQLFLNPDLKVNEINDYLKFWRLIIRIVIIVLIKIFFSTSINFSLIFIEIIVNSIFILFLDELLEKISSIKENDNKVKSPILNSLKKCPIGIIILQKSENSFSINYYNEFARLNLFLDDEFSANLSFSKFQNKLSDFKRDKLSFVQNTYRRQFSNEKNLFIDLNKPTFSDKVYHEYYSLDENHFIISKVIDIKGESDNNFFRIVTIDNFKEERNNMMSEIFGCLKSKIILTISHELNNPLNGLIHSSEEIINATTEKKKRLKSDQIRQFSTLIKIFIKNLTLYLKFTYKESFNQVLMNINFEINFMKIHRKFSKLLNQKSMVINLFNKLTTQDLIVLYDFHLFKYLIQNIYMYIYYKLDKKSVISLKIYKEKSSDFLKLIFKSAGYTNLMITQEEALDESSDLKNTVQTIDMLKEIIMNLCNLMKVKIEFKDNSNLLNIKIHLFVSSYQELIDDTDMIVEMSPKTNSKKKNNLSKLNGGAVPHNKPTIVNCNSNSFDRVRFDKKVFMTEKLSPMKACKGVTIHDNLIKGFGSGSLDMTEKPKSRRSLYSVLDNRLDMEPLTELHQEINSESPESFQNQSDYVMDKNFFMEKKNIDKNIVNTMGNIENFETSNKEPVKKKPTINFMTLLEKKNTQIEIKKRDYNSFFGIEDKDFRIMKKFSLKALIESPQDIFGSLGFMKLNSRLKRRNLTTGNKIEYRKDQYLSDSTNENNNIKLGFCKCQEILIVDDEDFNISSLKFILRALDFDADHCYNGFEFLNKMIKQKNKNCCKNKLKLVFLDLMMPVMEGLEACKKIMELVETGEIINVPNIIVVSAHESDEIKERVKLFHIINEFVPKPIKKSKVREIICKYKIKSP